MRSGLLTGASSMTIALGLCATMAHAAETSSNAPEVAEVVVTGSFIAGTPQDSALPVSVISAVALEKQGSPTLVNLVKTLPGVYASYGESNRLLGNVGGYATLNLRGFGGPRTLVLMNGQRLAGSAPDGGQDINLIPTAAIGRIEILKDGAAATYGSDAVSGVVNFITRRDLKGLELNGDYSFIQHGGGDYNLTAAFGWQFDRGDALVTAGYRRRSEVRLRDVPFGYVPGQAGFDTARGAGGWSGASNPGTYLVVNPAQLATGVLSTGLAGTTGATGGIVDDGCVEMGGAIAAGTCRFHYSAYDNLVNDEYHYQLHGQLNFKVTDDVDFHMESSFARHTVPDEPFSPTQGTANFPTPVAASGGSPGGGASPFPARSGTLNTKSFYYIPFSNPGLTQYFTSHCVGAAPVPAYCANLTNGVLTSPTGWRAGAYGGNPNYPDGANHQKAMATSFRLATGLTGSFSDKFKWSLGANAQQVRALDVLPDMLVNRLQFALRGLGGPGCNANTGTPGVGACKYFNPFSNGIAVSKVNEAVNPFYLGGANPALNNDPALFAWMMGTRVAQYTTTIATIDPVVSGELPFFVLPGGQVEFAVGGQLRYNRNQRAVNAEGDLGANPCVDSIDDGSPTCTNGTGAYIFYPGLTNYDINSTVKAVFAEFRLPILDTLNASAAIRYEDYGDGLTSLAPKLDVKWQALPWLAFRASAGETLRAPSALITTPGFSRTLASFTNPVNSTALYRSVDVQNNPDLQPETAKTRNVGVIFEGRNFQFTADYYKFAFENELTSQAAAAFFSTMFPSASPAAWKCSNATLRAHFDFVSDVCDPGNLLLVRTSQINGPNVDTSGLDFQGYYTFNEPLGRDAQLTVGGDATHLLDYKRGAVVSEGITIAGAIDRAGLAELLGSFYSYPKWRGNLYANYQEGRHNLRITARATGDQKDLNGGLTEIKPYYQVDAIYRVDLPWETVMTVGVVNIFNRNPPRAVSQYNYDYTIGNPLGRVINVGFKKSF